MKSTFPDILSWRNFMVSFRLAASPRNGGGGGGSDGSCANAHAINRSRGSSPPGSSRRAGGYSPVLRLTADEMSLPYSPVPKSSPSGTRLYCRGGHFGSGSAPARSRTPQGRFPPARLLHPGGRCGTGSLRMLEMAAEHKFHFDSCQMPLNVLDAHFRSFEKNVVPKLVEQGIAVLGMKPLAEGEIPRNGLVSATECLHYALSLPTTVVINGCETMERLEQALEAARTFKPLTETQLGALRAKTKQVAVTGRLERFKTSDVFDGTAKNPQWMG